ncbi:hypothetical protein D9758_004920 [Tetrapyrgos nigripes]|uniref:Retrotransposon gag domain-containing protein n=1 Tax=Tetrapyrgos nigripes TaxID=182062 RepID=A0A8H5GWB5_9AGAR|nr:hypothetical protein D9758_004920 [Tetrapyrgos nigripes]
MLPQQSTILTDSIPCLPYTSFSETTGSAQTYLLLSTMSQRSQPRTPSPTPNLTVPVTPFKNTYYSNLFHNIQIRQHRRSGSIFAHPSPTKPCTSPFKEFLDSWDSPEPGDSGTLTQTQSRSYVQQQTQGSSRAGPSRTPANPDDGCGPPPGQHYGQGDDRDDNEQHQGGGGGRSDDGGRGPPDDGPPGDGGSDSSDSNNDDDDKRRQFITTLQNFNEIIGKVTPGHSEKTEVKKPDVFDGLDPKMLCPFLIQIQINLQNRPKAYTTDAAKISFTLSYLSGTALEFFELEILNPDPEEPAPWTLDFGIFVKELKDNFGVFDEVGDAEDQLEALFMKDSDQATKYCAKFQQLASQVAWDENSLRHFFRKGLAPQIKDALALVYEETNLPHLKSQVLRINSCYWRRQTEEKREEGSGGKGNSRGKGSGGNSSGSGSGKSSNSGKVPKIVSDSDASARGRSCVDQDRANQEVTLNAAALSIKSLQIWHVQQPCLHSRPLLILHFGNSAIASRTFPIWMRRWSWANCMAQRVETSGRTAVRPVKLHPTRDAAQDSQARFPSPWDVHSKPSQVHQEHRYTKSRSKSEDKEKTEKTNVPQHMPLPSPPQPLPHSPSLHPQIPRPYVASEPHEDYSVRDSLFSSLSPSLMGPHWNAPFPPLDSVLSVPSPSLPIPPAISPPQPPIPPSSSFPRLSAAPTTTPSTPPQPRIPPSELHMLVELKLILLASVENPIQNRLRTIFIFLTDPMLFRHPHTIIDHFFHQRFGMHRSRRFRVGRCPFGHILRQELGNVKGNVGSGGRH